MCLTRWPLTPGQLYSFDNVNFAYAMGHFDISRSQPQPPGYPVFVVQMWVLGWLHFKRPESVLFTLRILGSIASCVALFWAGRRMFGPRAAWVATLLFSLQPAFWFAGLTSAVRTQLALVSALVAGCCWEAWKGNPAAATASSIVLGIGAGARPELGPVLLPLWAVGVWRAEKAWSRRFRQASILLIAVLVWLAPAALASGGPVRFWRVNWGYLKVQAGTTSGLFGANPHVWETTLVWLVVWTFCILLALPLPAALAWHGGFGIGRERSRFLWTWLLPQFAFAAGVHVAVPGHVLAMLPPVCLFAGHLMERAAEKARSIDLSLLLPMLAVFPALLVWLGYTARPEMIPWSLALGGAVIGVVWRFGRNMDSPSIPRWEAVALIVAPAVALSLQVFLQKDWYFGATDASPIASRIRRDIHSGFRQMSLGLVEEITDRDGDLLRDILALARERGAAAVAVSDGGVPGWRKLSYYAPWLPVIVVANGTALVVHGPNIEHKGREVWLPESPRLILATRTIPPGFAHVARRGAQAYVDPPPEQHEVQVGGVRLRW